MVRLLTNSLTSRHVFDCWVRCWLITSVVCCLLTALSLLLTHTALLFSLETAQVILEIQSSRERAPHLDDLLVAAESVGAVGVAEQLVLREPNLSSELRSAITRIVSSAARLRPVDSETAYAVARVWSALGQAAFAATAYRRYFESAAVDPYRVSLFLRQTDVPIDSVLPYTVDSLLPWYRAGASKASLEKATLKALGMLLVACPPAHELSLLAGLDLSDTVRRAIDVRRAPCGAPLLAVRAGMEEVRGIVGFSYAEYRPEAASLSHWGATTYDCLREPIALGMYLASGSTVGLVTVQGDPRRSWSMYGSNDNVGWSSIAFDTVPADTSVGLRLITPDRYRYIKVLSRPCLEGAAIGVYGWR